MQPWHPINPKKSFFWNLCPSNWVVVGWSTSPSATTAWKMKFAAASWRWCLDAVDRRCGGFCIGDAKLVVKPWNYFGWWCFTLKSRRTFEYGERCERKESVSMCRLCLGQLKVHGLYLLGLVPLCLLFCFSLRFLPVLGITAVWQRMFGDVKPVGDQKDPMVSPGS